MDAVAILGGSLSVGIVGALLHKLYRFKSAPEATPQEDITWWFDAENHKLDLLNANRILAKQRDEARAKYDASKLAFDALKKQLANEEKISADHIREHDNMYTRAAQIRDDYHAKLKQIREDFKKLDLQNQNLNRKNLDLVRDLDIAKEEAYRLTGCTNIGLSKDFIGTFGDYPPRRAYKKKPKFRFEQCVRDIGKHNGERMVIIRNVYVNEKLWGYIIRKETYSTDRLNPHYICEWDKSTDFDNSIMGYRATEKRIKELVEEAAEKPIVVHGELKKTAKGEQVIRITRHESFRINAHADSDQSHKEGYGIFNQNVYPTKVKHSGVYYHVRGYGNWFRPKEVGEKLRYMYVEKMEGQEEIEEKSWEDVRSAAVNSWV